MNPTSSLVLGHGGAGFDQANSPFPPNSSGSVEQALVLYGADGVEVDVQFTADSQFVLFHDQFLQSSTKLEGTTVEFSLAALERTQYRFGPRPKQTLMSLTQCLKIAEDQGRPVVLSLHLRFPEGNPTRIIELLQHQLEKMDKRVSIWIESERLDVLSAFNSEVKRFILRDNWSRSSIVQYRAQGIEGVSVNWRETDNEKLQLPVESGMEMMLYGIKTGGDVRTINCWENVKAVQVDNLMLYQ